ncbi:MAG TPA: DinB family protein [Thermomicrobiaceae bacterium]|nr:DinB family protein [Thermomicrobiaceae bacterium]
MEAWWCEALWLQFGAAIDMLDNALVACPESLWRQRLWPGPSDNPLPPGGAEFWYVAYHALFWLDLYLSGSAEGFAPPAPFGLEELDPAGVVPARPFTGEELRTYVAFARQKCRSTVASLTDEQARRVVDIPWAKRRAFSYLELQLYNMRRVQEHAAQLSLALGQHGIDAAPSWVGRATSDPAHP